MPLFARIINGHAFDVQSNLNEAEYRARNPVFAAELVVRMVPDGTQHDATDNGDGTFTNPPIVAKPLADSALSWAALTAYLVTLLGGGTAGRTALGAIIKSCQASASGADNFFAAYLQGQGPFTKAEFTGVLADVGTGIVSNPQKTAVATNWPKA